MAEARDPYAFNRRPTRQLDIGTLRVGGSSPVRVELAPRTPVAEVTELIAEIETLVRPARRDPQACEIIQLSVGCEPDVEACVAVAQGLRGRGLQVALAANVASLSPEITSLLPYLAKLNVSPVPHMDQSRWAEQIGELIAAAKTTGLTLQWNVSPACMAAPAPGADQHPRRSPPAAMAEGPEQGGTLVELAHLALALARLCQARAFDGYLVAVEGAPMIPAYRLLAAQLAAAGLDVPLTLKTPRYASENTLLCASLTLGSLLCDGFGDVIEVVSDLPSSEALRLSYNILQGARRRISKTEFISCPSCGRTQFDLETTTQRIKAQTGHLTGVKIAIMGCIVNGPGEMADADFGYVGAGPGKINLYVGKECVERNIAFDLADQKLIELIKKQGKWTDRA
jgi:(E)-4-hydroxy-3-methylbut-2-enyl-diphosphate synthase